MIFQNPSVLIKILISRQSRVKSFFEKGAGHLAALPLMQDCSRSPQVLELHLPDQVTAGDYCSDTPDTGLLNCGIYASINCIAIVAFVHTVEKEDEIGAPFCQHRIKLFTVIIKRKTRNRLKPAIQICRIISV
ncbi:MAG: hypothetical protein GF398_03860 [Chitinivibrionales bacterium]|nr:hypothetical protein [Chitinivibrionales bacterium]